MKEVENVARKLEKEIKVVTRIGKYSGGKIPLKLKFRSQVLAEKILAGA